MLNKFLKEVVGIVVGKQAEGIVDLLISEKYVNEFLIAKKMDLTINQTRNILYKISDYGLVSSTRKKDKKKGWYTYSWKIEILKSLEFLKSELIKRVEQLNKQVQSRETKQFYVCKRCNIEISEENALLYNFTCNECGDLFTLKNDEKFLKDLRRNIGRMNSEIESINREIEIYREKLEKARERVRKKQEKIKTEERKKKLAERKLVGKKVAKKKVAKKKGVKKKVVNKKATRKKVLKNITKASIKKVTKKVLKKTAKKVAKKSVKKSNKKTKK